MQRTIMRAYLLSLDEKSEDKRSGDLEFSGDRILFTINPSQIVTLGIDF